MRGRVDTPYSSTQEWARITADGIGLAVQFTALWIQVVTSGTGRAEKSMV